MNLPTLHRADEREKSSIEEGDTKSPSAIQQLKVSVSQLFAQLIRKGWKTTGRIVPPSVVLVLAGCGSVPVADPATVAVILAKPEADRAAALIDEINKLGTPEEKKALQDAYDAAVERVRKEKEKEKMERNEVILQKAREIVASPDVAAALAAILATPEFAGDVEKQLLLTDLVTAKIAGVLDSDNDKATKEAIAKIAAASYRDLAIAQMQVMEDWMTSSERNVLLNTVMVPQAMQFMNDITVAQLQRSGAIGREFARQAQAGTGEYRRLVLQDAVLKAEIERIGNETAARIRAGGVAGGAGGVW